MRMRVRTVVLVVAMAAPAHAQDRLFMPTRAGAVELGALGHFGDVIGSANGLDRPVAGGGRYIVRGTDILDRRTGSAVPFPASSTLLAVDPARPRVFIAMLDIAAPASYAVAAFDVATGAKQPLVTAATCGIFGGEQPPAHYAVQAETLFVSMCGGPGAAARLAAVDLRGATPIVRPVPVSVSVPPTSTFAVTPDATRVFVAAPGALFGGGSIEAFDAFSGASIRSVPVAHFRTMAWDDAGDRLVVDELVSVSDATLAAFDRDLRLIGAASFAGVSPCGLRWQVSAHTGRIYLVAGGSDYHGAPGVSLAAYDGASAALVAFAPIPALVTSACDGPVLRTAPGAPRLFRAALTGGDVALEWENIGGASQFVLEVGFSPGRTDAAVFLGPDSRAVFSNVPPGIYYLRLRGGNEFGGGRPSTEIRVTVP